MTTIKWGPKKYRVDDRHCWVKFSSIVRSDDGTGSIESHWDDHGSVTGFDGHETKVYYHIIIDARKCEHCGLIIKSLDDKRMTDDCPALIVESIHES